MNRNFKKPNILVAHGSPYMFHGLLIPFLKEASYSFNIFVITTNYFIPSGLISQLDSYRNDKIIENYLILPVYENGLSEKKNGFVLHQYVAGHLKQLREKNFDICLINGSTDIWQRYIIDCALSERCIRVGFYSPGFALGIFVDSVSRYSDGQAAKKIVEGLKNPWDSKALEAPTNVTNSINSTTCTTSNIFWVLYKKLDCLINGNPWKYIVEKITELFSYFFNRYLYPMILVRRFFREEYLDSPTWFDSDRFEKIITFQYFSKIFLTSLYDHAQVYLADYPLASNCFCRDFFNTDAKLLVCLRLIESEQHECILFRDVANIAMAAGIQEIHIRPHPRSCIKQMQSLVSKFNRAGFRSIIKRPLKPLREIVCCYRGVVGTPSTSLLEARFCCPNCFVFGLLGGLKSHSKNPKYLLGEVGQWDKVIDWVDEDGRFDLEAIRRKHRVNRRRPSLTSLLTNFVVS